MAVSVRIESKSAPQISCKTMLDGHAYKSVADDRIYIGNRFEGVVAYSICGNYVVEEWEVHIKFVEVDLEIIVKG